MAPAKMMSVARPKILGPIADKPTLSTAVTSTAMTLGRSGRSRPSSLFADGPNSIDF